MIDQATIEAAIATAGVDVGHALAASLADLCRAVEAQLAASGGKRKAAGKLSIVVSLDHYEGRLFPTVRVTAPGVAYKAEYSHDDLADYPELPGLEAAE